MERCRSGQQERVCSPYVLRLLAKQIPKQSLALLVRKIPLPNQRNRPFDERETPFVIRRLSVMIPAVFFAGPRFEWRRSAPQAIDRDQQLFRFNRREHEPHAHPGFEVDHHGVGFE